MKQAEVLLLQLLGFYFATPFAVQYVETTGDFSAVRKRVNEVLLYLNSSYTSLKSFMEAGVSPFCQYMCIHCFRNERIDEKTIMDSLRSRVRIEVRPTENDLTRLYKNGDISIVITCS